MTDDRQHPGHGRPAPDDDGRTHFDELDAVRRFPPEEQWLELPLPPADDDGHVLGDAATFADRVLRQKHADEQLDRDLAGLDAAMPADRWLQFEVPAPRADFVDATVAAIQRDRRQRWQSMLARYVAPEPSPAFVSRTLAALNPTDADADGRRSSEAGGGHRAARGRDAAARHRLPLLAVAAAAAALLLWQVLGAGERAPLELRLARQAPPAVAYADATSPLAAVLARVAADDEPFAVFDAPADGLWLSKASGGPR